MYSCIFNVGVTAWNIENNEQIALFDFCYLHVYNAEQAWNWHKQSQRRRVCNYAYMYMWFYNQIDQLGKYMYVDLISANINGMHKGF